MYLKWYAIFSLVKKYHKIGLWPSKVCTICSWFDTHFHLKWVKLCMAIISLFYNISPPNFVVILISVRSSNCWDRYFVSFLVLKWLRSLYRSVTELKYLFKCKLPLLCTNMRIWNILRGLLLIWDDGGVDRRGVWHLSIYQGLCKTYFLQNPYIINKPNIHGP